MRKAALAFLGAVALAALLAGPIAGYGYDEQLRELPGAAPSAQHWLGTDELGRDRWARLLYGARVSFSVAPLAALLATLIAAAAGLASGLARARGLRWADGALMLFTDAFLGLPWLFALLAVRAALPLNMSSTASLAVTGLLMAVLGWPSAARIVRSSAMEAAQSMYVLQAEAAGLPFRAIAFRHVAAAVKPVLKAQFLSAVPAFLLAEASLSLLGLGVAEPLPSLGNLMRELTTLPPLAEEPWLLAPALLLVSVVMSLECFLSRPERSV